MEKNDWLTDFLAKVKEYLLKHPIGLALAIKTAVIEIQSRKNGKRIRKQIPYIKNGDQLHAVCKKEEEWWKNLRAGAPVDIIIKGKRMQGWGEVVEEEHKVARIITDFIHTFESRMGIFPSKIPHQANDFPTSDDYLTDLVLINVKFS